MQPTNKPYSTPMQRDQVESAFPNPSAGLGVIPKEILPTTPWNQKPSWLTYAAAGPLEELFGPLLTVILISQDVRATPRSGVHLYFPTLTPTLLSSASIGWIYAQWRAAPLGHQIIHCHADPGKLPPSSRQAPATQPSQQNPPPKGAHDLP